MDEYSNVDAWKRFHEGWAAAPKDELERRSLEQAAASMNVGMHGVDMRGAANMQNIWRTDEPWQPDTSPRLTLWQRIKRKLRG